MWVSSPRAYDILEAIAVGLASVAVIWLVLFFGWVPDWAAQQGWSWWAEWILDSDGGALHTTWIGIAIWLIPPALFFLGGIWLYPTRRLPDRKK